MSKSLVVLVLAFSVAGLAFRAPLHSDARADAEAVERAVRDYVEAIYQVKPELIDRSVHPALEKLGRYRPGEASEYRAAGKMTFEQLRELSASWNANGQQGAGADLAYDVEVFDVLDVTAAAKLTADWGVDYMHLSKAEGRWKIVQILWQSHPPSATATR